MQCIHITASQSGHLIQNLSPKERDLNTYLLPMHPIKILSLLGIVIAFIVSPILAQDNSTSSPTSEGTPSAHFLSSPNLAPAISTNTITEEATPSTPSNSTDLLAPTPSLSPTTTAVTNTTAIATNVVTPSPTPTPSSNNTPPPQPAPTPFLGVNSPLFALLPEATPPAQGSTNNTVVEMLINAKTNAEAFSSYSSPLPQQFAALLSEAATPEHSLSSNPANGSTNNTVETNTDTSNAKNIAQTAIEKALEALKTKGAHIPLTAESLAKAGDKIQTSVIAPGAPRYTLDDCVKIALQKNPTILTAINTVRQQSGNFITVRAAMIPQFGVTNAAYQWQQPELSNTSRSPLSQIPINQSWGLTLGGSQLLYNGGTAMANIKAAKLSEQMAYYQLRTTIDSVIAQVIAAYYQVILNRALVVANEIAVAVLSSQVQDQESRFQAGTVPFFNVLQVKVQLANARPLLITARNNLRLALFQLVQLIGINYPNMQSVQVPFDIVGELSYHPRKINSDESIYTALQRSPTLKAQRQNILIVAQNVRAALGGYLPTLTATAGYQLVSADTTSVNDEGITTFDHDLSQFVSGWFFGVQGSWAIFDGLATYGNVKQQKANLMIAKATYDNGVRQVILSVQQAISNMQQAEETVNSLKINSSQAAESLRLAQERLHAGDGVQLDVLNSQVQLLLTQEVVLQSEYNYIVAASQYDQALSLNTQYEEFFDDPMNHRERRRYKTLNSNSKPQPLLPRALRSTDLLPCAFKNKKSAQEAHNKSKKEIRAIQGPILPAKTTTPQCQ
ncbi:MAG: hypothetical protein A3F67_04410 [Verrucomicrobia bacterium RIFCSPHIGHO2_12_FULL_41_10]|nr:MAG: hypothetical protein A3F67_04410 [Verrucomicrobia bacterium RIFCSPHIGHO2_12_FULL_41_10]